MYIIDGQNSAQMQQYQQSDNTNKFNPCIPMTFNSDKSISITFDICDYEDNTFGFQNEYLFDGGSSVIINKLTITDYIITQQRNYPISVNNASMSNINASMSKPLFYIGASIYIFNTSFDNIDASDVIFYGYHDWSADHATRIISFKTTSFENLTSVMIFESTPSKNDALFGTILNIKGCSFIGINCMDSMFYDGATTSNVIIDDVLFDIVGGKIYSNIHSEYKSYMNVSNAIIESNQLTTDNAVALFEFQSGDTVSMEVLSVKYSYVATENCIYASNMSNEYINGDCELFDCENPIIFINNLGEMSIANLVIDIDIHYGNMKQSNYKYHRFAYEYAGIMLLF